MCVPENVRSAQQECAELLSRRLFAGAKRAAGTRKSVLGSVRSSRVHGFPGALWVVTDVLLMSASMLVARRIRS